MKPDIRLVIATLAGGGSERVCVMLANQWADEGRRVEILLVRRTGVFLESLDSRVSVASAEVPRVRHALWWFLRRLNRWPDVPTLLFGFDLGVGLGALKRCGLISAPLVYREGNCPLKNIPRRSHWRYRMFVGCVEGVIAQSRYALATLQSLGVRVRATSVICNPLPGRACAALRGIEIAANGPRLVAVGRLSPEKGFLRLLDAVVVMQRRRPGVTLTIAGEGSQRAELEARISAFGLQDSVHLLGFVAEPWLLLQGADCFVLSSHYEGQPNALLEALQSGCRVVAAGGEGVGEMLGALGLDACWIREQDFTLGLEAALDRSAALPDEVWVRAQGRLRELTDIRGVARAYREFMERCRC